MLHKDITHPYNHIIHSWEVADTAARLALVVTNADIGKVCRQLDTGAYHILIEDSPMQWETLGSSGEIQSVVMTVKNSTGVTIGAGVPVYISGAVGSTALISLADADAEATSSKTIGLTKASIPNNTLGTIVLEGRLTNIDTSAFAAGDLLYLSAGTAGTMTTTRPAAPNHGVFLGYVLDSHASNGIISVKVQNGYEMQELHNVDSSALADNDVLVWDTATNLWLPFNIGNFQPYDIQLADLAALNYAGNALYGLRVNAAANGLEFTAIASPLTVKDEGVDQSTAVTSINFTGAGVTASAAGGAITVNVTGGGGGGLTNFTDTLNTTAPNATQPVAELTASNAATNVDLAVKPKGTGALLAQTPDSTVAGGNKRGASAIDLQRSRGAATQVASGQRAVILSGFNNTASQTDSAVMSGFNNNAAAQYSFIANGSNNTASGNACAVIGAISSAATSGNNCIVAGGNGSSAGGANVDGAAILGGVSNSANKNYTAVLGGSTNAAGGSNANGQNAHKAVTLGGNNNSSNGESSVVMGQYGNARGRDGSFAHGGHASSTGIIQYARFVYYKDTTTATPANVGWGAGTTVDKVALLSNSSAVAFRAMVSARQHATGDASMWEIKGAIKRGANAAATALVGTPTVTLLGQDAGAAAWAVAAIANTTLGCLDIQVTGEAAKTIRWAATIEFTEAVG